MARESIRGVVKVRMSKRGDVTGEVLAPTRGGVVTQLSVDDGTGPEEILAESSAPALAAPPSAMKRTGPTEALPDAPRRPASGPNGPSGSGSSGTSGRSGAHALGIWISIAVILAALATIVVTLAR